MPFKTIVVPVDFSPTSERALETAKELATHFAAELHLFHSYPSHPLAVAPYAPAVPVDYLEELRAAAVNQLNAWRAKHCPESLVAFEHVSQLPAAMAIVDLAEEVSADLIVIGTRGHTGLKHAILGSVAERVVRTAPCAVLTVKE